MYNPDLISVLMPVYNAEPFLEDCLLSILNQSEKGWELLAVDDFSADGSFSILRSYALKDSRVRVFRNTSKGIISALRLALRQSRGGFITRMDADDRMTTGKLAALKKLLLYHGPGHVSTGLVKYFSDGELGAGYLRYERWLNALTRSEENYREIYRECVIPSPCWMTYREDLLSCGAFSAGVYPEDYDLCFRFYQKVLRVRSVAETLHWWRDHAGRTSRNDEKYADAGYFSLKVPYFLDLEVEPDNEVWLWGAGRKGKAIAKLLKERTQAFRWICDNHRKIGKQIYGIQMGSPDRLREARSPKIIIAVSNEQQQAEIRGFCEERKWSSGNDYFFFT